MSYFIHYRCTICEQVFPRDLPQAFCSSCQSPILAVYDLERARLELSRDEFRRKSPGMWRWSPLLPVLDPAHLTTLGEGDTPLLDLPRLGNLLGLTHLFLKDEALNPTGSFKARGMSVAVSKARELGLEKLAIPSAGNAGGALAAYAARARLPAFICMPEDTPDANIRECRLAGAEVELVPGLISDCAALIAGKVSQEGWFDLSTFKEPWRVEGKKIIGYELAEAFGWRLPEVIVFPTGGGTGLVGMWKAFQELQALGWLEGPGLPRLVAVQSAGCAPIVRAFAAGAQDCEFWPGAHTLASGLRVPRPFAGRLILQSLRESQGSAVAGGEEQIVAARALLGRLEGIHPSPEGAAALAGLQSLVDTGWVSRSDRIVLFNTGLGLKYIA